MTGGAWCPGIYNLHTGQSSTCSKRGASDGRVYPSQEDIRRQPQKQRRQYDKNGLWRSHGQNEKTYRRGGFVRCLDSTLVSLAGGMVTRIRVDMRWQRP